MDTSAFRKRYKVPVLISLLIALAVITLGGEHSPIWVAVTFVSVLFGMLLVDLGSVIDAYVVDPSSDYSKNVIDCVKNKRINDLFKLFNERDYEVQEPTVKSALFQLLLMIFVFYVSIGGIAGFAQALVMSFMGSLLYFQMMELQSTKTLKRWFWIYNGKVSDRFYLYYVIGMVLAFVYSFSML